MKKIGQRLPVIGFLLLSVLAYSQNTYPWPGSGNIGIGTATPSAVLHIHNNVSYTNNTNNQLVLSNGGYRNFESGGLAGDNAGISFYMTNYNAGVRPFDRSLDIRVRGSGDGTFGASMIRFFASDYAYASEEYEIMRIHGDGNVGIGTKSPTEKLSVNGNIRTKKIIVSQVLWSDYVFDPVYKLRSLQNLESYIRVNKHLPDIPSEKEVIEKGMDVGDMQALLLKKVEELTLYIISQERKLHMQEQKINTLLQKERQRKRVQ